MIGANTAIIRGLMRFSPAFLPFADAATEELPMSRLLRLSLFQVTVGMAAVLLIGTLNRVMIVELAVPSSVVASMLALPLLAAPFRTLIGFRSDTHRSFLGWRRSPFIWAGTMLQFGGLAIMPFALLILSGDTTGPAWVGYVAAGLAFLLVGAGLHTVQTIGLALATDLAPEHARPRVVALLCGMLLLGMVASAIVFGWVLSNFSQIRLVQVIQGAAVVTIVLNGFALWKQEPRSNGLAPGQASQARFSSMWSSFSERSRTHRRLLATGIGTAGFSMQDILLEPYGGKVLELPVAATTALTAMLAAGGGVGLVLAARWLNREGDPHRVAAVGCLIGIFAFAAVILAAPMGSQALFAVGVTLIGAGAGMFAHGTLTATMALAKAEDRGLALGAWGASQAMAAGIAIGLSGALNDFVSSLATSGALGEALVSHATSFALIYAMEILLLFATVIAIGPLVGEGEQPTTNSTILNLNMEPGGVRP